MYCIVSVFLVCMIFSVLINHTYYCLFPSNHTFEHPLIPIDFCIPCILDINCSIENLIILVYCYCYFELSVRFIRQFDYEMTFVHIISFLLCISISSACFLFYEFGTYFNPFMSQSVIAKTVWLFCCYLSYKGNFQKIFEGEMSFRTLSTTLFQIFCKFMPNSKAIFKGITGPDDTCQGDL